LKVIDEPSGRFDHSVVVAIEDSLIEVLGADLALAVRVCLDTSVALMDPMAYAEILEEMVGSERSESVLRSIKGKLTGLNRELKTSNRSSFSDSITNLKSRFSPEVILGSR